MTYKEISVKDKFNSRAAEKLNIDNKDIRVIIRSISNELAVKLANDIRASTIIYGGQSINFRNFLTRVVEFYLSFDANAFRILDYDEAEYGDVNLGVLLKVFLGI